MGFKDTGCVVSYFKYQKITRVRVNVLCTLQKLRGSHLHLVLWQVFALAGNVDPFVYIGQHSLFL